MRRYRERKRCGLELVLIEVDVDLKGRLVDLGYLPPEAVNDRQAKTEAFTSFVEDNAYKDIARGHS